MFGVGGGTAQQVASKKEVPLWPFAWWGKGVSYPEKSFSMNKPFLKKSFWKQKLPESPYFGHPSCKWLAQNNSLLGHACISKMEVKYGFTEICKHKLPKCNLPTFPAFLTSHLIEMCGSIAAGEWYRYCQIICYAVQCCTNLDNVLNSDSYECGVSKRLSRATSVLPIC